MALIAGVDGCRAGWFCVVKDTQSGDLTGAVFPSIAELVRAHRTVTVIAIDVPIGLPEQGARACDQEARTVLGSRRSSVFPAPIRSVLGAASYREACDIREAIEGKRMQWQAFNIMGKIREVDTLLLEHPEMQPLIWEVHPEVAFWAMKGGRPLAHNKKKNEGAQERRALLGEWLDLHEVDALEARYPRNEVARDDVIDSLAVLWTAARLLKGEARSLPEPPPTDSKGLPMAIWY